MGQRKPCESILMFIQENMVNSQSLTTLESFVGDYVFNTSLSTRFVMYLIFIDIF
ncbi:hypothetical protein AAG906_010802 [Vitis piasezkii]